MTPKFHALTIAQVKQESSDAISVLFNIPSELREDYRFIQGQHITFKSKINGQELRRSYSICSTAGDNEIKVAIKKVPGGAFSNWANSTLKKGDLIEVMTPEGKFHTQLNVNNKKHYVAFAAGSGITPILSIIKSTLKQEPLSSFTLVFGNSRQSTILFQEELEDLKNKYLTRFTIHNIFSREEQEVPLLNGRLDAKKVNEFLSSLLSISDIDEAFICGPGGMIDEVESALKTAGLSQEKIHLERFGVPDSDIKHRVEVGDAPQATITVIADGLKRDVQFREGDESILEVALKSGMDLPFSCKGGVCNTCRCKVLEGKVRMDRNFALEPDDVEAGFVLSCQSHPLTEKVVISFDNR